MSKNSMKTVQLTQLTLLIALLAVLTFTPIGFIQIPPVAITILHIPVIVGAVVMGPKYGAILGLAFGIFSMLKATFMGASPADLMFSPFASGAPVQSLIMCVVPRILLGVIAGALYLVLTRKMPKRLAIALSAGVATLMHTVMVLGCMWFFFKAIPFKAIFMAIVGVNGILELASAVVSAVCICVPLLKYTQAHGVTQKAV